MSREQGDTNIDLGSTKNYFGERRENNSGSREKKVKFQREPGAGDPPLRGLIFGSTRLSVHLSIHPCPFSRMNHLTFGIDFAVLISNRSEHTQTDRWMDGHDQVHHSR